MLDSNIVNYYSIIYAIKKMLQVLLSTMNQKDFTIIHKLNIKTKSITVNQINDKSESIQRLDNHVMYNLNEKGVGLSRNLCLLHATEPILLFADDDMRYYDDYEETVLKAYKELPEADVIIFDIKLLNSNKNGNFRNIHKCKKLNKFNAMRYGACRISARNESLKRSRVSFSTQFGGGCKYSAGEDSLFLIDCFNKKLNVYQYPKVIAEVDDSTSTWFNGINEKLIKDRGILYYVGFPKIYWMLYVYYAFKLNKKTTDFSVIEIFKLFILGKKEYKFFERKY